MVQLWNGSLSKPDAALQLLLIMAFIADWARDVYRENILKQIAVFASTAPDYPTVPSPMSSTITVESFANLQKRRTVKRRTKFKTKSSASTKNTSRTELASYTGNRSYGKTTNDAYLDPLRDIKNKHYAYRDSTYIRNRIIGLFLTKSSIASLLQSTPDGQRTFARIADRLGRQDVAFMRGSTLQAMENSWNGEATSFIPSTYTNKMFYVLLTFSAYFSPDWQQTRELCYIAIASDAVDKMFQLGKGCNQIFRAKLSLEYVLDIIACFEKATIRANLVACMFRCSIVPKFLGDSESTGVEDIWEFDADPEYKWLQCSRCTSRDLVAGLHEFDTIRALMGERVDSTSYLRDFSRLEQQPQEAACAAETTSPWRIRYLKRKKSFVRWRLPRREDLFLVYDEKKSKRRNENSPQWCLFILQSSEVDVLPKTVIGTRRIVPTLKWKMENWNQKLTVPKDIDVASISRRCIRDFKKSQSERINRHLRDREQEDLDNILARLDIGHEEDSDLDSGDEPYVEEDSLESEDDSVSEQSSDTSEY